MSSHSPQPLSGLILSLWLPIPSRQRPCPAWTIMAASPSSCSSPCSLHLLHASSHALHLAAHAHALSRSPSVSPRRTRLRPCIAALRRGLRRASSRGSRCGLLPQPSARTRTALAYSARPPLPLKPHHRHGCPRRRRRRSRRLLCLNREARPWVIS